MQAHLQARGLDVWRVTELGKKNVTKAERQYDAIAKSIPLSSLCDSVFNRVFANEKTHQAKVNKKKRMRKIVMINQVQLMKNI